LVLNALRKLAGEPRQESENKELIEEILTSARRPPPTARRDDPRPGRKRGAVAALDSRHPSIRLKLIYLLVFGAGSIIGMMLMSWLVGLPAHLTATRFCPPPLLRASAGRVSRRPPRADRQISIPDTEARSKLREGGISINLPSLSLCLRVSVQINLYQYCLATRLLLNKRSLITVQWFSVQLILLSAHSPNESIIGTSHCRGSVNIQMIDPVSHSLNIGRAANEESIDWPLNPLTTNGSEEEAQLGKSEATNAVSRLDRLGAAASLVCAAHCAAMPLLIGLLPLVGLSFLGEKQTELMLVGLSLGIGISSLIPSYARKHRQWRPLLLFAFGTGSIIAVKMLAGERSCLETPAMVLGALLIACAHVVNRRLCQNCATCHPTSE
jgi:MerC mercury resistance protein